jgi:type III secretion protein J
VDSGNVVAATEITRDYALPRAGHTNLGDLFSRQGLISNPGEDQVRYVYGLTQELSETLEKIDGVLVARVHVVQPERDPLMRQVTAPSASVMIRYRADYNLDYMKERIRGLVAGGVEGLTPDHVYLTLVPVTPVAETREPGTSGGTCAAGAGGGSRRAGMSAPMFVGAIAAALIVLAWVWSRFTRARSPTFFRR